jgi:hypothetical protein
MKEARQEQTFTGDLLEGVTGDLIVFDGVCVLFSGFVELILRRS